MEFCDAEQTVHSRHVKCIKNTGKPDETEQIHCQLYKNFIDQIEEKHHVKIVSGNVPGYGMSPPARPAGLPITISIIPIPTPIRDIEMADVPGEQGPTPPTLGTGLTHDPTTTTELDAFLGSLAQKPATTELPTPSSWPASTPLGVQAPPALPYISQLPTAADARDSQRGAQSAATVDTQFTEGQTAPKQRGRLHLGGGKTPIGRSITNILTSRQQQADTAAGQTVHDEQDAPGSPVSSRSYSPSGGPAPAQGRHLRLGVDPQYLRYQVKEQQPLRTWRTITHPLIVPEKLDVPHFVRAYAEHDIPQLADQQRGARLTAHHTIQLTWITQKLTQGLTNAASATQTTRSRQTRLEKDVEQYRLAHDSQFTDMHKRVLALEQKPTAQAFAAPQAETAQHAAPQQTAVAAAQPIAAAQPMITDPEPAAETEGDETWTPPVPDPWDPNGIPYTDGFDQPEDQEGTEEDPAQPMQTGYDYETAAAEEGEAPAQPPTPSPLLAVGFTQE